MAAWHDHNVRFSADWNGDKPGRNFRSVNRWRWDRIIIWTALASALVVGVWKAIVQW